MHSHRFGHTRTHTPHLPSASGTPARAQYKYTPLNRYTRQHNLSSRVCATSLTSLAWPRLCTYKLNTTYKSRTLTITINSILKATLTLPLQSIDKLTLAIMHRRTKAH
mmetsp:Transcript_15450/g.41831  ORF Transcript_15450/g.41831 Transcript_15450/m.41831 type:complete len:108 (-) Transcript_15450:3726-4049(-)